jgi:hypothetical protein
MTIILLFLTFVTMMISMLLGMVWWKAFVFAGFTTTSMIFLGAAFLDWLAKTHAVEQRLLPVCVGLGTGVVAFAILLV